MYFYIQCYSIAEFNTNNTGNATTKCFAWIKQFGLETDIGSIAPPSTEDLNEA